jgi:hypothetical protein
MTVRRMLVDLRDDDNMRGFHVLASLALIADRLRSVELYRLGGDAPNENIAMQSFSFETQIKFRPFWRLILFDSKFDIYVSAANVLPCDAESIAARKTSRRKVLAVMFEQQRSMLAFDGVVLKGHDTAEIAHRIIEELRLPGQGDAS